MSENWLLESLNQMSDKAIMRVQTTVPILAIIFGCIATGKFVSDVSYIRQAIESQGVVIQTQALRLVELNERLYRVEAFLGINQSFGKDGQLRK